MSETENKIPDAPVDVDLNQQCADLRRQVNLLLIGLIVCSLTLAAFVGLQFIRVGKELNGINQQQAMQIIELNKQEAPALQNFVAKLVEYSKTHPDFVPILNKNGIRPGPAAPASPAAPKK